MTPGPWRHQRPRGRQRAIDRKWEIVAPIAGGGEQVIVGEHTGIDCLTEDHARLIAEAPAMLDALRALVFAARIDRLGDADGAWRQLIASAETVLSRAEGKA